MKDWRTFLCIRCHNESYFKDIIDSDPFNVQMLRLLGAYILVVGMMRTIEKAKTEDVNLEDYFKSISCDNAIKNIAMQQEFDIKDGQKALVLLPVIPEPYLFYDII